jgi:hypothetical protein
MYFKKTANPTLDGRLAQIAAYIKGTGCGQNDHPISAVVICESAKIWDLRNKQPVFFLNPFATHPLNANLLNIKRHILKLESDTVETIEGQNIADILFLPNPWPPVGT